MDKKINGLKGVCCLVVCLEHMAGILLPGLLWKEGLTDYPHFARAVYMTPLNFIINGSSALLCFYVLSGYVLPLRIYKERLPFHPLKKLGSRYVRLAGMAWIGTVLGWTVMKAGAIYHIKLLDVSASRMYAGIYNHFIPGEFFGKDGPLVDAFVKAFLGWSLYDSPIGSLCYLWLGSLPIYLIVRYIGHPFWRRLIYAILLGGVLH